MTEAEKNASITRWLRTPGLRVMLATSALGPGFDYAHVRLVIHIGEPDLMTDFSQESGRAGRDKKMAESIILLPPTWKPQPASDLSADQEAMQLFLTQRYCSRGVLSQFLDEKNDWRWCMEGEERCGVCQESHSCSRPEGLVFRRSTLDGGYGEDSDGFTEYAGPQEVLRQDRVNDDLLARYRMDFKIMQGTCLYCRMLGRDFGHAVGRCSWRWDWINAKKAALKECQRSGKSWMPSLIVCWICYQPQNVCRVADPEVEDETECLFRDMVMPLCYGKFMQSDGKQWVQRNFGRAFETPGKYMIWLGAKATFGGVKCVQANCVAALALSELG